MNTPTNHTAAVRWNAIAAQAYESASHGLQRYRDYAPTAFDTRGLNEPDRQHWLVAPVIRNRDSGALELSNFAAARKALREASAGSRTRDVKLLSFGHWACGWFEVLIVRPGTEAARVAGELRARLENYPILDEDDHSERERAEADEIWANCYSVAERIAYIRKYDSQFEFHDFADMLACVRGKYFAGYASELCTR